MKSFTIKQVTIGSGIPKICVPIVAHTKDELLEQLSDFDRPEADLLEWRIDYMDCLSNTSELVNIANTIQARLPKKPLLITFRSQKEGGEQELSSEDYFALLKALGLSDSSSSPSIAQKPPIGKRRKEYVVSLRLNENIFGPIPRANSFTLIPESLAVKK